MSATSTHLYFLCLFGVLLARFGYASLPSNDCIIGNAVCRNEFGASSYCIGDQSSCSGSDTSMKQCTCGSFFDILDEWTSSTSSSPATKTVETTSATSSLATTSSSTTTTTTSSTTTHTTATTTTTTTTTSTPALGGGSSLFLWTEWPSLGGKKDWIRYYGRLREFITGSKVPITQVFLRILHPEFGTVVAGSNPVRYDLWTVSTDSVLYINFLAQLPSSVVRLMVYPYLMDAGTQTHWKHAMGTSSALEAVYKYTSQWNNLLDSTPDHSSSVRFTGIVVDGEEKAGYGADMPLIPRLKVKYNVPTFAYTTGFTQVGAMSTYGAYADEFYFEMYDFYVENASSLQLVQNTDVSSPAEFIDLLNQKVWSRYLTKYKDPRVSFMWSLQNSAAPSCLYPITRTSCGSKKDFGTQSFDYFIEFVARLNTMYPDSFGKNPHGLFQFSFTPTSWYQPSD